MPKPITTTCSVLAAIALPGAAGWYLGGRARPTDHRPEKTTALPVMSKVPAAPGVEGRGGGWMERVRSAAAGEFPALLAEVDERFPDDPSRAMAKQWLLGLWVSRDVDGAIAYSKAHPGEVSGSLGQLIGTLLPEQTAGLLESSPPEVLDARAARYAVARLHPRVCLQLAAGDAAGDMAWAAFAGEAIAALARIDPADAAREMAALPDGPEGSPVARLHANIACRLVKVWAQADAAAARRWIDALPPGAGRTSASHAWLGVLAVSDPRAAWRELESFGFAPFADVEVSSGAWSADQTSVLDARPAILENLAKQSPQEALTALASLLAAGASEESRDTLESAITDGSAGLLPREPAAFLTRTREMMERAGLPPVKARDDGGETLLEQLFIRASHQWSAAEKLEAVRLATADTGRALDISAGTLGMLLRDAAADDPQGAVRSFAGLSETGKDMVKQELLGALRGEALREAVAAVPDHLWSAADGASLAARAEENVAIINALPDTTAAGTARRWFASEWGSRDPEAASEWVQSLPPSAGSAGSARGLAGSWAGYDDTAASAWAASLPEGPVREGAAAGLVPVLARRDPEAAWEWATIITDARARAEALAETAKAWKAGAPPEFRTELADSLREAGRSPEEIAAQLQALDAPAASGRKGAAP